MTVRYPSLPSPGSSTGAMAAEGCGRGPFINSNSKYPGISNSAIMYTTTCLGFNINQVFSHFLPQKNIKWRGVRKTHGGIVQEIKYLKIKH